jgi:hypothetical protein
MNDFSKRETDQAAKCQSASVQISVIKSGLSINNR